MIFISGIVISIFLAALLLLKKNRSNADNYLLLWILLITVHQLYYYFDHSSLLPEYPFLIGYDLPVPLLHGPFLFLYASALVDRLPKKIIYRLLHFIPALSCYLYLISFYILSGDEKLYIINHEGVGYEIFLQLRFWAIIISGISYVLITILLLRNHQKKIKDNFSDIEKINLKWLQYLNYGIGIIWLTVLFGTDELTFIAVVIYVIFIGVYGIRQTPIFTNHHLPSDSGFDNTESFPAVNPDKKHDSDPESTAPGENDGDSDDVTVKNYFEDILNPKSVKDEIAAKEKYRKSGLSEQDLDLIHQRLNELMLREKLYTDPEITLGDIAQKLNIHPNYLSQVINTVMKKNFYDYINSRRVEEFTRVVQDPKNQHFTLLSLAYGCGFNSKSSFNRNFRKVTGVSPSHYLHQMNLSLEEVE